MSTVAGPSRTITLPAIGTALLLPQDRIARAPLGLWAAALRGRLRGCLAQSRTVAQLSDQVGSIANNAALIAAHRGAGDVARRLCHAQLSWQARLSRRAADPTLTAGCVQPWINLARLDSLAGDWESALARLGLLRQQRKDGTLVLRPLLPGGVGCQQVRAIGGLAESLESVYVIDTLRVLLQNGRFGEVVAFVRQLAEERRSTLGLWADEAAIVATCRRGDTAGAEQAARTALTRPEATGWGRAVFRLRLAEVLACAGERERAAGILEGLAAVMERLSEPALRNLQTLYVLMPMARACWAAGLEERAASLGRAVLRGSRAADDEAFQVESLRLLASGARPAEREALQGALEALELSTEYRRYRRQSAPSTNEEEFQALRAELEGVIGA